MIAGFLLVCLILSVVANGYSAQKLKSTKDANSSKAPDDAAVCDGVTAKEVSVIYDFNAAMAAFSSIAVLAGGWLLYLMLVKNGDAAAAAAAAPAAAAKVAEQVFAGSLRSFLR